MSLPLLIDGESVCKATQKSITPGSTVYKLFVNLLFSLLISTAPSDITKVDRQQMPDGVALSDLRC
jgi:hypothetical protein